MNKNLQSKIVNIFLPILFSICCGCSKEPSHLDGSFEYPQHMFWMRNKESYFPISTRIWRPDSYVFIIDFNPSMHFELSGFKLVRVICTKFLCTYRRDR